MKVRLIAWDGESVDITLNKVYTFNNNTEWFLDDAND